MLRFRATLLVVLVGLVLLTVITIGVASYLNSRSAAQELANQVLDQTSQRIDEQVNTLLSQAVGQCSLTRELMNSGHLRQADQTQLVGFWKDTLTTQPGTTALFLGRRDTGESIGVSRLEKSKLSVWQTTKTTDPTKFTVREFVVEEFPQKPFTVETTDYDVRTRPWFRLAAEAGRPIWTPSYVFLGVGGVRDVLGVTYAVPVMDERKQLQAVVMADFDLVTLSRFLASLRIGKRGSAFLVEQSETDTLRVIAHPRPELLIASSDAKPRLRELGEFDDDVVKQMLAEQRTPRTTAALRFSANGEQYLGSIRTIHDEVRPRWLVCTYLPEAEVLTHAHRTTRLTILICLIVLAIALLMSLYLSRQVAHPLEQLATDTAAAGRLQLESRPHIRSMVLEVDQLAKASEEMKTGLRSFEKYLPVDLVRELLDSGQEARLGVQTRTMTISFSDIVGFTSIAEAMTGQDLVHHLGEYFEGLSRIILQSGGTVDKFIGDAIMAFWGAPKPHPSHATEACLAAYRCQRLLRDLAPVWESNGRPPLRTRFGIHTGEALVGNIGSPARMNYTVMGDTVNLASRLEGLNKYYGTGILLSESTFREAKDAVVVRPIDRVAVVGKKTAVSIYELVGITSEATPEQRDRANRYSQAYQAYQNRAWSEAVGIVTELHRDFPDDAAVVEFVRRCQEFLRNPPDDQWDGVNRMASK